MARGGSRQDMDLVFVSATSERGRVVRAVREGRSTPPITGAATRRLVRDSQCAGAGSGP